MEQVLQTHGDEVWFLQFSHNGKFLASSSKDQTAIIWEVNSSSPAHDLNKNTWAYGSLMRLIMTALSAYVFVRALCLPNVYTLSAPPKCPLMEFHAD